MKRWIFIVFIGFYSLSTAQTGQTIRGYYMPFSKFNSGFDGSYILNSSAITTQLGNNIISGAYIGNEIKDRVFNNFDEIPANIGGDVQIGAHFVVSPDSLFKRRGISWFGAINHRIHFNGLIPRDAFGLAAFGNARYEGQSATISGLEANYLNYQQLQAGLMFNKGNSGVGLSFLKGQQMQRLEVPISSVFTANDGEFIEMNLLLNASQTDRERRNFHHFNGVGASFDAFTYINLPGKDNLGHRLLIEVKDLGFIHWNNRTTNYTIDSTYRFDGFAIENLFTLSDSILGPNLSDSTILSNASSSNKSLTSFLPAFFHLADVYQVNEDLKLMGGLMYRIAANYNMYYYLRAFYQINPNMEISSRLAWGGYGLLSAGTALKLRIKQKYEVTLGTENLEGWILPKYSRGSSAFIGFQRRF
jgi:hypothetical protein